MSLMLQKSAIDPALFEIIDGDTVVKEVAVSFRLYKWPRRFASVQEIERWLSEEERKIARGSAYRLLGMRNQSTAELRQKMARKGISSRVAEEMIEELKRLGLVSDADFEITLIEKEMRKGYGPQYIEMKLRSMGLDAGQVRKIATEKAQRETIRKLLPKLKNPAARLQRRGFDRDLILSELRQHQHASKSKCCTIDFS